MLRIILILLASSVSLFLTAQQAQWTWIGGDSTRIVFDVYGNRRVFDPVNRPGAINPLTSFKGKDGNFYMFGGSTLVLLNGFTTVQVPTCALWKYSPLLNQWSMPTGSNGSNPSVSTGGEVLGTEGAFSPSNTPGYLSSMSANWTDSAGNWWLFGGKTGYREFGTKCTFWKYDMTLSQWMVVKSCNDDSWASYGTQGIGHNSNTPGARQSMLAWKDRNGRFYIFGGYNVTSKIYYADVWMYDPASNEWTWQNGKKGGPGESGPAVRGPSGVFASENTPGMGTGGSAVLDSVDLNDVVRLNVFTETWLYSMSLNQWAWISGDRTAPTPAAPTIVRHYGTQGVASVLNNPGTRSAPATWSNRIYTWLYGGTPLPSTQNTLLSDLWKYNSQTTEWTWVSGDSAVNLPPNYGFKGIPSPVTVPGARNSPLTWVDTQGDMWLLGGTLREQLPSSGLTTVRLNDLWKISAATNAALPSTLGDFAAIARDRKVRLSWNTKQEHNTNLFNIQRSTYNNEFITIGFVQALGNADKVTNYAFEDNSPFDGINYYRLQQVDKNNSIQYSQIVSVAFVKPSFDFKILSNPVQHVLSIELQSAAREKVYLQVKDARGRLALTRGLEITSGPSFLSLPLEKLQTGIYFLSLQKGSTVLTKRFVKM